MSLLVLGAGISGIAALRAADRRGLEAACYDERTDATLPEDISDVELHTGPWRKEFLGGVDRVVTSPGFPPHKAALTAVVASGLPVVTEAGFGFESLDSDIIAVTGTNGKSTVATVTAAMLAASGVDAVAAGNIGNPISDIVETPSVVVAELSSFQLAFLGIEPKAATILNIAPDHLDWHGTMESYVDAKASIVDRMNPEDVFAANADDPVVMRIAEQTRATTVPCSGTSVPENGNGVSGDDLVIGDSVLKASTPDSSYRFDLVVAATLALHLGANDHGVADTVGAFHPGSHRRNVVADIDGVQWVNDSKATNPHAATAAASAYPSVRLLAGGRNKDLDLSRIGSVPSVVHVYAFGESANDIATTATRPATVHDTMRDAIEAARKDARPGDVVLLSPGCTSFDEFASYAERGQRFEEIVNAMEGGVRR